MEGSTEIDRSVDAKMRRWPLPLSRDSVAPLNPRKRWDKVGEVLAENDAGMQCRRDDILRSVEAVKDVVTGRVFMKVD